MSHCNVDSITCIPTALKTIDNATQDTNNNATAEDGSLLHENTGTSVIVDTPISVNPVNCEDGRCLKQALLEATMCASCHVSAKVKNDSTEEQSNNNINIINTGDEHCEKLLENDDKALQTARDSICYSERKKSAVNDCSKPVRKFYKRQNELIEQFEEIYITSTDVNGYLTSLEEKRTLRLATKMSIVTFCCNLVLLLAKLIAAVLSGSLVIISSLLDSAMDLISGVLMWWSNRAIKNTNYTLYPRGRRKLEPVAIVVLAVIMSFVSVQLIHESVQKMIIYATHTYEKELNSILQWTSGFNISRSNNDADWITNGLGNATERTVLVQSLTSLEQLVRDCAAGHAGPVFETPTVAICIATIIVKLVLYLVCRRIDNPSVQALAKDHFNDVISNSGAIACGLIGYRLWKYADPIGAIVISLWIIVNWSITAHDQIKMLTGYTAEPGFIKKMTWLTLNHDPRIQLIDSVIAFHFGNKFLVEIKVVLPGEMSMRESHDLCEALQKKIERLPEVERAFIHIDYECSYYAQGRTSKSIDLSITQFANQSKNSEMKPKKDLDDMGTDLKLEDEVKYLEADKKLDMNGKKN